MTACGLGCLTPLVKLAVELYKSGGELEEGKAARIVAVAAGSSMFIAAFAKLLGPQAAIAVVLVAGMVPPIARGEPHIAREQAYRMLTSLMFASVVGYSVTALLWFTPLAPVANVIGKIAGMGSSMLPPSCTAGSFLCSCFGATFC